MTDKIDAAVLALTLLELTDDELRHVLMRVVRERDWSVDQITALERRIRNLVWIRREQRLRTAPQKGAP